MKNRLITVLLLCVSLLFPLGQSASALPLEQKKVFGLGVNAFDVDPGTIGTDNNSSGGGCSADSSGGATLSGTDNEEKVWHFLTGKGLKPVAAAGIMGNFIQEQSQFDPAGKQAGATKAIPDAGDGKTGFGIAQWTDAGRQARLFSKIKAASLDKYYGVGYGNPEKDKDIPAEDNDSLLNIELNYAWDDDRQIKSFADKLNAATSVEGDDGSTIIFHKTFEASGDNAAQIQQRVTSAKKILAQYGETVDSGGGVSGSVCGAQLGGVNTVEDAVAWAKKFVDDTADKYSPGGKGSQGNKKNADGSITVWITSDRAVAASNGGCWGATYCGQCVAASGWFVTKMTDYTFVPGNGKDIVSNLATKHVKTGTEPKPFSIFSASKYKKDGSSVGGGNGHTGIVLGVTSANEVITLENNWPASPPGTNEGILTIRKYNIKNTYSDVKFAYVGDKLKQ